MAAADIKDIKNDLQFILNTTNFSKELKASIQKGNYMAMIEIHVKHQDQGNKM